MGEFDPTMLDPEDDDFDFRSVQTPSRSDEPDSEPESILATTPRPDALMEGTVQDTTDTHAVIRLSGGTLGVLPFQELREGSVSPGDEKLVKVLEVDGEEGPLLSERKAVAEYAWHRIRRAYDRGEDLEGHVVKSIKGGYLVDVLDVLTAFMPRSHVDLTPPEDPESLQGSTVKVRVIECDRSEDNVVVSRRVHLEEERERAMRSFFREHEVGDRVTGTVKNIVSFGAFVDLGPVDGLLHENDLTWGPVRSVEEHVSEGETLEVKILDADPGEGKVSLGLKQKTDDPWQEVPSRYGKGETCTGEVISVLDDAVLLRVEEGIEGRIPADELAWTRSWRHPSDRFSPGDTLEVEVLSVDVDRRRLVLSRKRVGEDPWPVLQKQFPEGTVLSAPVVDVREEYLTVRLLKDVHGVIRRRNVSWEEGVDPRHRFTAGEKITCKILRLDPDNQIVELGIKQTEPDPWVQQARRFEEGQLVEGEVTGIQPYGAFVRVAEGVEGLVHVSEMGEGERLNPQDVVEEGEEVGVQILSIDEEEHKVDLSMQGYREAQQRKQVEEYMQRESPDEEDDVTMGDLLGDDLEDLMEE